jgi:hypothetical protein
VDLGKPAERLRQVRLRDAHRAQFAFFARVESKRA